MTTRAAVLTAFYHKGRKTHVPLTMDELKRRCADLGILDNGDTSAMVKRMCDDGDVSRAQGGANRKTCYSLTDRGVMMMQDQMATMGA
jgi:DNA-binding transcriptional regulator PaaX